MHASTTSAPTLLALATFTGVKDNKPTHDLTTWKRMVARLLEHEEREEKDGPLYSPALYKKGTRRALQNIVALSMLVLDFDDGTSPEALTSEWEAFEYVVYSTHSHSPAHPKWRAVFPLSAQVRLEDWPRIYRNLATALGQGHTDRSCKDASRIYYWPSCPHGALRFASHHEGQWLDPAAFPDVTPEPAAAPTKTNGHHAPESALIVRQNGRVAGETLLQYALDRAAGEGRNNAGMWLACQLRDNGFAQDDAERWMRDYQEQVPGGPDPYTWDEAAHSLEQAWTQPAREAWEQSRPFTLGKSNAPAADADKTAATHAAWDAVARLKDDAGAVYETENLTVLAEVRRWDPVNWARIKKALKLAGVSMRDLDRELDRLKTREPVEESEQKERLAGDMLDECPVPNLRVPSPYVLHERGVGRVVSGDLRTYIEPIALAPILITGRAREIETGQTWLVLAWRWEGTWRSKLVLREQVLVGRKLADLAAYDYPYLDACAKDQVDYLGKMEAANRETLPCARVTAHLGWQGEGSAPFLMGSHLVLPDGTVEKASTLDENPEHWSADTVMFYGPSEGSQQIVNGFHAKGSKAKLLETYQMLSPYPRFMFCFYAGFAATLLEPLGCPNFIVDIHNTTTMGKTTMLRSTAAPWGNPDERDPQTIVQGWNNTSVYIERYCSLINSLPTFLDDTKNLKNNDKRIIADVTYAVANGRGRGRGTITGIARTGRWRTILFSTGEQAATSYSQDGGTRTRTLSLSGLPFGEQSEEMGTLARLVNARLCSNYGHLALPWLTWLMKEIEDKERWVEWEKLYVEWTEYYTKLSDHPEAGRVAQYAALVTVAGVMAHQALDLPWEYTNPTLALWPELSAESEDAAGADRALAHVVSWAYSHKKTFYTGAGDPALFSRDGDGMAEMSGRWDAPGWDWIAFYPHVLDRVLRTEGFDPLSVRNSWRIKEWLKTAEDGGKPSRKSTCPVRVNGGTTRMVVLLKAAVEAVDTRDGDAEPLG